MSYLIIDRHDPLNATLVSVDVAAGVEMRSVSLADAARMIVDSTVQVLCVGSTESGLVEMSMVTDDLGDVDLGSALSCDVPEDTDYETFDLEGDAGSEVAGSLPPGWTEDDLGFSANHDVDIDIDFDIETAGPGLSLDVDVDVDVDVEGVSPVLETGIASQR